jgi:Dolichyl-phosphate-mannose-protein mannosyltransferase
MTAEPERLTAEPGPTAAEPTTAGPARAVAARSLLARRPELAVAGLVLVLLLVTSTGYGWYRDELYWLQAGRHLDWGYPDQPLLCPWAVATAYSLGALVGAGLLAVHAVAAVCSTVCVALVGGMAGEAGGGTRARLIAATCWGAGATALTTGHYLSTGTLDVLATTVMGWCLVRAVVRDDARWTAAAGVALAFGLTGKLLIGTAAACLLVSFTVLGPRRVLRSRWLLPAGVLAVLGIAPYLWWQQAHGWPQVSLVRDISTQGENTFGWALWAQSEQVGLLLVPVWLAGAVYLARRPRLRAFAGGYALMALSVLVLHGRGYYTCGLVTVLVAFGGIAVDRWLARGGARRTALVRAVVGATLVINIVFTLPVVPERYMQATGINAMNPIAGDEVGWPQLARTVAGVWSRIPASQRDRSVIFTSNYGQAGAVDLFGPALGLPRAYSGHNAYGLWGPPDAVHTGPVVLVGFELEAARDFRGCRRAGAIDDGVGLANNEQGAPLLLCDGPAEPWSRLWPRLVHYDLGVRGRVPA